WQAILELEDNPVGRLLPDAGNGRKARDITTLDRAHQFQRLNPRQHGERDLWPNAAYCDQAFEQVLLEDRCKAKQLQRIPAKVSINPHRNIAPRVANTIER